MKEIVIDGKAYRLVPVETTEQEEELLICELNGCQYFLGPEAPEEMTWQEAIEWRKSLDDEYELPNRIVLLACFMNPVTKQKFKETWYWSSTGSNATHAWCQLFNNGNQLSNPKRSNFRVRAVRRVGIDLL